jgi:hypothetical protein
MQSFRKNRKVWSVLTALVAVIWTSYAFSGAWGMFCPTDTAGVNVIAEVLSGSHPEHASLADEHTRICKCLDCPGGKRCCCLKNASSTPQEQALLTARCSDEMPVRTVVAAAAKIVFPAGVILPAVFSVQTPVSYSQGHARDFVSRTSLPLLPPPRLS